MKIVIQTLFIFLLFSCKTKIEDNESTEFICEILSDTTELKIITSKNTLVSNFDWTPNRPIIGFDDKDKEITQVTFISEILEEIDTLYVHKQLKSKNKIDFEKLKSDGFKIFDLCTYSSENLTLEEIRQKASELNAENKLKINNDFFIMFKNPIFNRKGDKVYLRINYLTFGTEYLFIKENVKRNKSKIGTWME